ncbi:pilin [Synechococcus sp. MIT S1220]|uniref:pilin n=1 Tax=Synechococcus sp. MIT S1220 TaxID=3082549 RepID=UPI0039AF863A
MACTKHAGHFTVKSKDRDDKTNCKTVHPKQAQSKSTVKATDCPEDFLKHTSTSQRKVAWAKNFDIIEKLYQSRAPCRTTTWIKKNSLTNHIQPMKQITIPASNNGFTITELVVVLAISAMLSSVAVAIYNKYTERAKITEAVLLIRTGLSNGAAMHKESPLENTLNCESLGLETKYIKKWDLECNHSKGILSISANNIQANRTLSQNISIEEWTINLSTGVIKRGAPKGI